MAKKKFYGVRKGFKPGVYENWADCKAQVQGFSNSEHESFLSRAEAEEYVAGCMISANLLSGIANSSIDAEKLCAARQQVADNSIKLKGKQRRFAAKKSSISPSKSAFRKKVDDTISDELRDSGPSRELESISEAKDSSCSEGVYQLEYDGASKGNPGKAGAGALLRHPDGSVICELRLGLGTATNNVAEYNGLLVGLQVALENGIKRIHVQGDSNLVCQQLRGNWAVKHAGLVNLQKRAKSLSKGFTEFSIDHVDREMNSLADSLANAAIGLPVEGLVKSYCASWVTKRQSDNVSSTAACLTSKSGNRNITSDRRGGNAMDSSLTASGLFHRNYGTQFKPQASYGNKWVRLIHNCSFTPTYKANCCCLAVATLGAQFLL